MLPQRARRRRQWWRRCWRLTRALPRRRTRATCARPSCKLSAAMIYSTAACMHTRGLTRPPSVRAAQPGKLPLHYAAKYRASEAVVVALLAAYRGAAKKKCGVRPLRQHNRLRCT